MPVSPLAIAIFGTLGTLIAAGIITAAVIGALRPNPPADTTTIRVDVTGCTTRTDGYWNIVTATYTATNPSNRARDAFIHLSAVDADGGKLGTTASAQTGIPAGQTVSGEARIYLQPGGPAVARCVVDRVQ